MTLTLMNTWGHVQRPWGYEVRVDFVDENGRIYNETLNFRYGAPDQALLASTTEERRQALLAQLDPPAEIKVICEDGTEILL